MPSLGKFNSLTITELAPEGAYLDGLELGEVFLPHAEVPADASANSIISVFVYLDSKGVATATTKQPHAQVGDFCLLRVKEINSTGAFVDIGIDKDLLVPFNEQGPKLEQGRSYLIHFYLDKASGRMCGSTKLNKFLDKTPANYIPLQEVDLIIAGKTDLGYKTVVNQSHWGIIYHDQVFRPLFPGQKFKGFVRKIREDNKLDITLEKPGMEKIDSLSQKILDELNKQNGFLALGDKSDPEKIKKLFATSKANYKKAIGGLYKQGLIDIEATHISLK
jgi:predicted RNA-binding protein (virulence factor B family)